MMLMSKSSENTATTMCQRRRGSGATLARKPSRRAERFASARDVKTMLPTSRLRNEARTTNTDAVGTILRTMTSTTNRWQTGPGPTFLKTRSAKRAVTASSETSSPTTSATSSTNKRSSKPSRKTRKQSPSLRIKARSRSHLKNLPARLEWQQTALERAWITLLTSSKSWG